MTYVVHNGSEWHRELFACLDTARGIAGKSGTVYQLKSGSFDLAYAEQVA